MLCGLPSESVKGRKGWETGCAGIGLAVWLPVKVIPCPDQPEMGTKWVRCVGQAWAGAEASETRVVLRGRAEAHEIRVASVVF